MESNVNIHAIVLTKNEEIHIERCLNCLRGFCESILVVDSFSDDRTLEISKSVGADVVQNEWVNYSSQFNYAIEFLEKKLDLSSGEDWVFRVDADEVVEFGGEVNGFLSSLDADVGGVLVKRKMVFREELVKYGGVGFTWQLRLWRAGLGRCENRWMDEHIEVESNTVTSDISILDHSLKSITWWIDKHNSYASREAVDILHLKYGVRVGGDIGGRVDSRSIKRYLKEKIYLKVPGGVRAALYFIYRYFILFGLIDKSKARSFHFLQGYWYRNLVDIKVSEVEGYMKENSAELSEAIRIKLGIDISKFDIV